MKKERFYYGDDITLANLEVVLNKDRNIVATGRVSDQCKFPRVSICGIYNDEDHTMTYGVALCSSKDVFKRDVGRELSRKRAQEKPYCVINTRGYSSVSEAFIENAKKIEQEVLLSFKVTS